MFATDFWLFQSNPMCASIVQVAGGALNGALPNGVGKASKLHVVDGRRS